MLAVWIVAGLADAVGWLAVTRTTSGLRSVTGMVSEIVLPVVVIAVTSSWWFLRYILPTSEDMDRWPPFTESPGLERAPNRPELSVQQSNTRHLPNVSPTDAAHPACSSDTVSANTTTPIPPIPAAT